jgi:hypothetical protein
LDANTGAVPCSAGKIFDLKLPSLIADRLHANGGAIIPWIRSISIAAAADCELPLTRFM